MGACFSCLPLVAPPGPPKARGAGLDALCIGDALDGLPTSGVPPEVAAKLRDLGLPPVRLSRRIKTSFHATYMLELGDPRDNAWASAVAWQRAVLQIIGSELGDKTLFDVSKPISSKAIEKASFLAQAAGVRVPQVWATGEIAEWGGLRNLPFVIYEFIETATVENEVKAPQREWRRISMRLREQLGSCSLAGVDTEPLPRYEDASSFVAYLVGLAEEAQAADLVEALRRLSSELKEANIPRVAPTLIHQDLNDGNILCSPDPLGPKDAWRLDALIDWEGAVVGDPRICFEPLDPWSTLRKLARVTKQRWLASRRREVCRFRVAMPRNSWKTMRTWRRNWSVAGG